jgi:hypothetical protein
MLINAPRASLEHVGKVFGGCNQASVPIDVRLADEIRRSVSNELRLGRIVDQWGNMSGKLT